MPKKKLRLPSKRERDRVFVSHNVPRLIKSAEKVRTAANELDKAMKELVMFSNVLAPFLKNGGGK